MPPCKGAAAAYPVADNKIAAVIAANFRSLALTVSYSRTRDNQQIPIPRAS